ncbi:MAG: hypothetical protein SH848_21855 [Saprospiraceae bacterium]|nr:hypothetical protein [Saprospiraceae bacterium]MDZ4706590.1 hypothetical protein [Saprospiraceae bacterium]
MMVRKIFLGTLLCCLFASNSFGQVLDDEMERPGDKVQAARVAYITRWLNLTTQESERFWPLYNEYEGEMEKIRTKYKPFKRPEDMTDAEAERLIVSRFEMEQELLALKREYFQKFKTAIPTRKILQFTIAEKEFRKELLRKMRENGPQRQGNGRRRN